MGLLSAGGNCVTVGWSIAGISGGNGNSGRGRGRHGDKNKRFRVRRVRRFDQRAEVWRSVKNLSASGYELSRFEVDAEAQRDRPAVVSNRFDFGRNAEARLRRQMG